LCAHTQFRFYSQSTQETVDAATDEEALDGPHTSVATPARVGAASGVGQTRLRLLTPAMLKAEHASEQQLESTQNAPGDVPLGAQTVAETREATTREATGSRIQSEAGVAKSAPPTLVVDLTQDSPGSNSAKLAASASAAKTTVAATLSGSSSDTAGTAPSVLAERSVVTPAGAAQPAAALERGANP